MQDSTEQQTPETPSIEQETQHKAEQKTSLFSNGSFVIVLIVLGLFIALITWSVSFSGLFFGAVGTLLSVASCCFDHHHLRFKSSQDLPKLEDENWAYFLMRALVGSVLGTATALFALHSIEASPWANIAVLSMAGAFVFDYILFKRHCHKD
ncbi:hypothetical protein [Pelistega ratti]|uniref:hypothetical protein n=1 Tax=Pelistega ratti TaxID=2652177 RepID=UPI0013592518|nr:hypothetical protein [Pelistega ratti]